MTQAYVFIHIGAAKPQEVLTAIQHIPQVQQAHIVLGPIDCIAFIECADHEELRETIIAIRWVAGVVNTDTRYVYR